MRWAILGIIIGILLGLVIQAPIPPAYTSYVAVAIIGVLDAFFGAIRAEVTNKEYNDLVFASGLIFNIVLAILITYLGEKLGIDLALAASVVFIFRILQNIGVTRRSYIDNYLAKKKG